jgi:hypothetical protein
MKNKIKNIRHTVAAWLVMSLLGGCTLLGLDLQENYEYDHAPLTGNQLGTDGWEFITSRADLFSNFIEAVKYAGVDTTLFDRPDITLFPPTNQAIAGNPAGGSGTNLFPGGYWSQNPVNDIVPDRWEAYPEEQVKQFVLNHIMRYAISYNEFLSATRGVRTFFPTMATNGYGYISLHMLTSLDTTDGNEAIALWVNDFPSHYTKLNPALTGYGMYLSPRTSNLQTKSGSYIHVMDYFLDFPTDTDLAMISVYSK